MVERDPFGYGDGSKDASSKSSFLYSKVLAIRSFPRHLAGRVDILNLKKCRKRGSHW
jgi:hypothetical protein